MKLSNWHELNNLVETLERVVVSHSLQDLEIFLFKDNSAAEAAFWKGTSCSSKLFDLVLRLNMLELKHRLILHVVHVSGQRMIAQGTNGLSQADHSEGVMKGRDIRGFIPLHLTPTEREPTVREWFWDVTSDRNYTLLKPEGWLHEAHWDIPPAAAVKW
jgi:hypothetical protein